MRHSWWVWVSGCSQPSTVRLPEPTPIVEVPIQSPVLVSSTVAENREDSAISVLRVPLPPSAVQAVVVRFFAALAEENLETLSSLFAPSALAVDARGNETSLIAHWTKRVEQFEYQRTALDSPIWQPDIVVLAHDDDRALAVVARLKPKSEDRIAYVPIRKRRYDGHSLFSEALWFQLRAIGDELFIVACTEALE